MIKILIVSLGCDKNLVDTEKMMAAIRETAHRTEREIGFTDDELEADIIVVNTCCFIGDAKEESINTLIELGALKENPEAKCRYLIAAGCLVKRYRDEILSELPEIDGLVDIGGLQQIGSLISDLLEKETVCQEDYLVADSTEYGNDRILTTGGHYAYLKIAEGCNKHCTYCIIPKVRGEYRSAKLEDLLTEARSLAEQGVRELILVAQETTCYGIDRYGKKCLPQLLRRLCRIEGLEWIRLLYCYPEEITEELIDVMAEEPKIVHYIDMPVQHAADHVLKRMGRRTDRAAIEAVIARLRDKIPDIAIRTTLISGFPGETEEEHQSVLDFVDETEFERLGVFPYSMEEDTAAALMEPQVDEETKLRRRDEIMELQQEIAFAHAQDMLGKRLRVLVEGKVADEPVYVGRSYMDAPGIDGLVFIHSPEILMSGAFVTVRLTGAEGYDLIGETIQDEFTE